MTEREPMNLQERAVFAYLDRREEQERQLAGVASRALVDVLGDVSGLIVGTVNVNPSGTSTIELQVEELAFKVNVTTVTETAKGSNDGLRWEEDKVVVFCRHDGKDVLIASLADLGRLLKDEPSADSQPKPEPV